MPNIFDLLGPQMAPEDNIDTSPTGTPSSFGVMGDAAGAPIPSATPSLLEQIPEHLNRMIEAQQKRSEWADSLLRGMLTEDPQSFQAKAMGVQGMSTGMQLLRNVLGGMAMGGNWGAMQHQRIQLANAQRESQRNALASYIANARADQAAMSQMASFMRNMQKDQELNDYRNQMLAQNQQRIQLEERKQAFNQEARQFALGLSEKKTLSQNDLTAARTKMLDLEMKMKEAGMEPPKTPSEFAWKLASLTAKDPAEAQRIFSTFSKLQSMRQSEHRPFALRPFPVTSTDAAGNQTQDVFLFNPNTGGFTGQPVMSVNKGMSRADRAEFQGELRTADIATGAVLTIQDAMKAGIPFGGIRGAGPVRQFRGMVNDVPGEEQAVYTQVGLLGPEEVKRMSGVQFSAKELQLHMNNHPQTTNDPEQMLKNAIISSLLTQASLARRQLLGNRDLTTAELSKFSLHGDVLKKAGLLYQKHLAGQDITAEDIRNAVNDVVSTVRTPSTAPLPPTAPRPQTQSDMRSPSGGAQTGEKKKDRGRIIGVTVVK